MLGFSSTPLSLTNERQDTAYKVFGGYQLTPHFALEAGYFNLGKQGFKTTTTPSGFLDGEVMLAL